MHEKTAGSPYAHAEDLVEMALELGVSLSLPDLIQAVAGRARQMFHTRGLAVGLVHGSAIEAVTLQDPSGQSFDRRYQSALTAALTAAAEKFQEPVVTIGAASLLDSATNAALQWDHMTLARLNGSDGELLGLLCLADPRVDVSGNGLSLVQAFVRHVAMALENSRLFTQITQASKQWAEIFDSLSDFIVLHDDQHRVMRVNRALAEFLGSRPPELIGIHMRNLLAKGGNAGMQPCPLCMRVGRPGTDQDEFVHPVMDRVFLLSTSRVHGAMNEGLQTIHVLRDITDRREAQLRYQELFDNVQEGLFFSSPEGRFTEVNDALVNMLGYASKEELMGIHIPTELYVSADERVESHRSMAPTGEVRHREIAFRRKNGSLMQALVNAFAVRDAAGEVVQYRGMILDVTETKKYQAQLQRERDFNHQILNNTQNMILVADTAGLVSYANRRCFESGAYGKADLVGHKLVELVDPADREAWSTAFDLAILGDPVDSLEVQVIFGDDARRRFSVNLSPMRGERDAVTSVVVVMTDITESSLIQAKLVNTEKLAAVGQLVSGVAHEVNNPLTAIMGFADLMLENPALPESAHQDLRVIMQEAERTKEIVQNLLSFARQTPPQRSPVELRSVLRRTVTLRSYDFSSHGVEVIEDFAADLPGSIGDPHQLLQVFLNILNNAYDAIRETERRGRIAIRTFNQAESVFVEFKDNGPGITNADRIFDPFFTTKDVGKGTGLGLSICYGIVRQHGGEITCRNNDDGPGATFTVKLPVAQARAKAAAAGEAGAQ